MRRYLVICNWLSGICFLLSSGSLLTIPFLELGGDFPKEAYGVAAMFWGGLLLGSILQLFLAFSAKRRKKKRQPSRLPLCIAAVCLVLLVAILAFAKYQIWLFSIDLACLLFSVEVYFLLKRGLNI